MNAHLSPLVDHRLKQVYRVVSGDIFENVSFVY
jgi:hypothetical protein